MTNSQHQELEKFGGLNFEKLTADEIELMRSSTTQAEWFKNASDITNKYVKAFLNDNRETIIKNSKR